MLNKFCLRLEGLIVSELITGSQGSLVASSLLVLWLYQPHIQHVLTF